MLTALQKAGSFSQGLAQNESQAKYPHLWRRAIGFWCPSVGVQGSQLFDFSGNGYHGVSTTVDISNWVRGPYGYAVNYGAGEYFDFGALDSTFISQKRFSMVTWMRRNSSGALVTLGKGTDSSLTKHLGIDLDATNVIFRTTDAYDQWEVAASNDTNWHCYGFSLLGSGASNSDRVWGYIDGKNVPLTFTNANTGVTMGSTSGVFRIGRIRINSVDFYSDGAIGDTFAWTRALSAQEHALLARGGSPLIRKRAGLVCRTPIVSASSIAAISRHYQQLHRS